MANEIFRKKYNLRNSDFDRFSEIKPSTVLDLFQDIAGLHAENLGIGFLSMLSKGYLWVIMKVKYEIVKSPQRYESVTVVTWPKEPKRLDFQREYLIENEAGETLIKGTSQWAVIDSTTRKLTRAADVYKNIDGFYEKDNFEEKLSRVPDFEGADKEESTESRFLDIDSNNHVNNIRYADFAVNALSPKEAMGIKKFQIDFHKEITQGEITKISVKAENNKIYFKGVQNGTVMFSCVMEK